MASHFERSLKMSEKVHMYPSNDGVSAVGALV